jgi:hypothetical protein
MTLDHELGARINHHFGHEKCFLEVLDGISKYSRINRRFVPKKKVDKHSASRKAGKPYSDGDKRLTRYDISSHQFTVHFSLLIQQPSRYFICSFLEIKKKKGIRKLHPIS